KKIFVPMKDPGEVPRRVSRMPDTKSDNHHDKTRSSLLQDIKRLSNASGWQHFYELYTPLIQRFALKFGLSPAESDDVVQNTMVRVAEQIPQFEYDREKGSFKNWLLGCAKWRILDVLRARPKNTFHLATDGPGGGHILPELAVFEPAWDDE